MTGVAVELDELEREAELLSWQLLDGVDADVLGRLEQLEDAILDARRAELRAGRAGRERERRELAERERRRAEELARRLAPLHEAGAAFVVAAAGVEREKGAGEDQMLDAYDELNRVAAGLGVVLPDLEFRAAPRLGRLAGHRDRVQDALARTPLDELARSLVSAAVLRAGNTAGEVA